jgi:glutamate synthase (NADPH/NADH) large chain
MFPEKQGLYDSAHERDSCGIGFVADIQGRPSHDIIRRGLDVLTAMTHRGAESADNKTGDGAGILLQIPHAFYHSEIPELPGAGRYGMGLVFLPHDADEQAYCMRAFEDIVHAEGLVVIAWRDVPTDNTVLGRIAAESEPQIKQIFITSQRQQKRQSQRFDQDALERKLYVVRKQIENHIRQSNLQQAAQFYISTLSTKTVVYKGMLMPEQISAYYRELQDERLVSAVALVHSRFSTNTFPTWDLAHPFRMIAHNGEINTLKGNRFWIQARESGIRSELFGLDVGKLLPIIEPGKSDSASFDNVLELLVSAGRSLPHALMMLIPESFNKLNPIPDDLKFFYEYHSAFMEPWDGPASMVFCDGRLIGGTLDRNGLRPSPHHKEPDRDGVEVSVRSSRRADRLQGPPAPETAGGSRSRARDPRRRDQRADQPPAPLPRMGGAEPHHVSLG